MWLKRPAVPVLGWSCVVSTLLWLMGNFWLCACYFPLPSPTLQCPLSGTEESPSCSSFPRSFMAAELLPDLTLCTHFVCLLTNQFWIGPVGDASSLPQNDETICTVDRKKNGLRRDWKWNSLSMNQAAIIVWVLEFWQINEPLHLLLGFTVNVIIWSFLIHYFGSLDSR